VFYADGELWHALQGTIGIISSHTRANTIRCLGYFIARRRHSDVIQRTQAAMKLGQLRGTRYGLQPICLECPKQLAYSAVKLLDRPLVPEHYLCDFLLDTKHAELGLTLILARKLGQCPHVAIACAPEVSLETRLQISLDEHNSRLRECAREVKDFLNGP